jgi:MFS family permease
MSDDVRDLWRGQQTEATSVTLDDIRARARKFERRIRLRNIREYLAGGVIIPFFVAAAFRSHGWRIAAPLLQVAGLIVVFFELHRRASAAKPDSAAGLKSSIESYIGELERQRQALESVWLWYLLPFIPGFLAAIIAAAADHKTPQAIGFAVFIVILFAVVQALNARGARKLSERIKELRTISANGEEHV